MLASFDINSHQILNLPTPVTPTDAVRLQDLQAAISALNPAPTPPVGSTFVYSSSYTTIPFADAAAAALGGCIILNDHKTLLGSYTLTCKGLIALGGDITLGNFNLTFANQYILSGGVQIFKSTGSGVILGTILGDVCLDWWGTTSLSVADSATTNAGNAAIVYSLQSSNTRVRLYTTKTDYYLSSSWVKSQSFNCPSFDFQGAIIHYAFSTAGALQIIGSSGSLSQVFIRNGFFTGTTSSWGIEVQGQCGIDIHNVIFDTNQFGLVLHNKLSGHFTEYVQWYACNFNTSCKQAWYYKITAGNGSFHGSGPREGVTVNTPSVAVGPAIVLDPNAVVYNAPYNFQIWPNTNTYPIISAGSNTRFLIYGTITIENFAGGEQTIMTSASGYNVLVGGVIEFSGTPNLGSLVLMDIMGLTGGGSLPGFCKRFTVNTALGAGGSAVTIARNNVPTQNFIVDVYLSAATGYSYKYTLKLWGTPSFVRGVTTLATEVTTNGAGPSTGAPTFSWNGVSLTITNASYPASAITAQISAVPMTDTF